MYKRDDRASNAPLQARDATKEMQNEEGGVGHAGAGRAHVQRLRELDRVVVVDDGRDVAPVTGVSTTVEGAGRVGGEGEAVEAAADDALAGGTLCAGTSSGADRRKGAERTHRDTGDTGQEHAVVVAGAARGELVGEVEALEGSAAGLELAGCLQRRARIAGEARATSAAHDARRLELARAVGGAVACAAHQRGRDDRQT